MLRLEAIWRASASAAYPPPACSSASARSYLRIARSRRLASSEPISVSASRILRMRHVEPAGRQDPVEREDLGVGGARVLRQVAHLSRAGDVAGSRQGLTGEDPGHRGLAGAVAADQADLVSRSHAEGDVCHQQARAGAHLEVVHGDHGGVPESHKGRTGSGTVGRRTVARVLAPRPILRAAPSAQVRAIGPAFVLR